MARSVRATLLIAVAAFAVLLVSAAGAATGTARSAYRVGPGDKLNIVVFGQADLSGQYTVDGAGRIAFPLLGQVDARDKTIAELREVIRAALDRDYLVDPKVAIDVVDHRPFYILGQVNKPGSYPFIEGMTVRMAVALAGGFTRRADEDAVSIVRDQGGGRQEIEAGPDDPVRPGDTIEVSRRLF